MRRSFYLLCTVQFLATFALMLLIPAMPLYLQQLNQGVALSGFWPAAAIAAPAVGALFSAPLIGKGCDLLGHKLMLMITQGTFVLALFAMALADTVSGFLAARLLLGFAGISLVLTVFFSHAGFRSEALQLASQQRAIALACLSGPLLGGYALDQFGIQQLLFFTACTSVLIWFCSGWLVPGKVHQLQHQAESSPASSLWSLPLLCWLCAGSAAQAGAFALVVAFALYCQPLWQHLEYQATLIGGLHATAWFATFVCAGFWGQHNQHGRLSRNYALAALGCAVALLIMPFSTQLWWFAAARLLQGACFAALPQTLFLQVGQLCPASERGAALGLARSSQVTGQILGPLSVAFCYDQFGASFVLWPVVLWFLAAAFCVVCPTLLNSTYFKAISK